MGGTTYFYQAAGAGPVVAADGSSEDPVVGVDEVPATAGVGVTMYPGTPSHVTSAKAQLAASEGQFYMSDDIRLEMLQKNAITLTQPDPTAYPGELMLIVVLSVVLADDLYTLFM